MRKVKKKYISAGPMLSSLTFPFVSHFAVKVVTNKYTHYYDGMMDEIF